MKKVRFLTATLALVTALFATSTSFAQSDSFLGEKRWLLTTATADGNHVQDLSFVPARKTFGLYLWDSSGHPCSYGGEYTFSGSTVTLKINRAPAGKPNPGTVRATVNTAKTQITLPSPLGGGNITFTKDGVATNDDSNNSGIQRPDVQKPNVQKPRPDLNRPQQERIVKPRSSR